MDLAPLLLALAPKGLVCLLHGAARPTVGRAPFTEVADDATHSALRERRAARGGLLLRLHVRDCLAHRIKSCVHCMRMAILGLHLELADRIHYAGQV